MLTRYAQHNLVWIDLVTPTPAEVRSLILESLRIGRPMPMGRVWKFLFDLSPARVQSEFLNATAVALLRRR